MPEWLRRLFGRTSGPRRTPTVFDLAGSVLLGDDPAEVERTASAWAVRQREEEEAREEKAHYEAAATRLREHVRRHGAYFPGDDL